MSSRLKIVSDGVVSVKVKLIDVELDVIADLAE